MVKRERGIQNQTTRLGSGGSSILSAPSPFSKQGEQDGERERWRPVFYLGGGGLRKQKRPNAGFGVGWRKKRSARAPGSERERERGRKTCVCKQTKTRRPRQQESCKLSCPLRAPGWGGKVKRGESLSAWVSLVSSLLHSSSLTPAQPRATRQRTKRLLTPWIEHGTFGLQDQRTTTVLRQRE